VIKRRYDGADELGVKMTRFVLPGAPPEHRPASTGCDGADTLVLVFGAPAVEHDAAMIDQVRAAFPGAVLAGCSSSGHLDDTEIFDDGLVGVTLEFEDTRIVLGATHVADRDDSNAAGQRLGEQLKAQAPAGYPLAAVLLLSDGVVVNGSELVRGLGRSLPPGLPVFGGLAGDHASFTSTWVLAGPDLGPGVIAAVGFYGERLWLSHGSHGGWETFGPTRRVTRSDGNTLYELDGRPALELYKAYLGAYAADLPGSALLFPLDVQPPDSARPVVRTVLAVDDVAQSMTFAGDVPVGSEARLMRATREMLIDGAQGAAERCPVRPVAVAGLAADSSSVATSGEAMRSDALAIAISCVGRRLVLGERAEEELEAVRDVLGREVGIIGFYSNGEVAPVDGFSDLHNQTMTLTVLSEV
jgi:hypothetical protein